MHSTGRPTTGNDSSRYAEINDPRSIVTIVKVEDRHIRDICLKDVTGEYQKLYDAGHLKTNVDNSKWTYAAENAKGQAIAIVGVFEYWPGRSEAWAYLTTFTHREFMAIHRAAARFLDRHLGRIECVVYTDFVEGNRWVKALGFKKESVEMKGYFPGKPGVFIYARVKE